MVGSYGAAVKKRKKRILKIAIAELVEKTGMANHYRDQRRILRDALQDLLYAFDDDATPCQIESAIKQARAILADLEYIR